MVAHGTVFWSGIDDKGIQAKYSYSGMAGTFRVTVGVNGMSLYEEWNQSFSPNSGVSMIDWQIAAEVTERLAQQIEEELGL